MSTTEPLFGFFFDKISIIDNTLVSKPLVRSYINLFLPGDWPNFHPDQGVITAIFYINPEVDLNQGGETQFFLEDKIVGVIPKPGRLCVFDGSVNHRASSFRSIPRITVVYKFKKD